MQPLIISTTPINGSQDVSVDSLIVIEFAEAVLTSTVDASTFTLENMNSQTSVTCDIVLDNTVDNDDGDKVTITPHDDEGWNDAGLNGLTSYKLTITGVASADGTPMSGSYTLDFRTVADAQDEIDGAEDDAYVEESQEVHGRLPASTEEPEKTYAEIVEDNKEYLDYVLDAANATAIDWDDPTYPAKQYVTAKSKYDVNYAKYIKMTTSAQSKKLADLSVSYRSSLSDLRDLLSDLRKQYRHWEDILLGTSSRTAPQVFQKGSAVDTVYDFHDRRIKNRDGEAL